MHKLTMTLQIVIHNRHKILYLKLSFIPCQEICLSSIFFHFQDQWLCQVYPCVFLLFLMRSTFYCCKVLATLMTLMFEIKINAKKTLTESFLHVPSVSTCPVLNLPVWRLCTATINRLANSSKFNFIGLDQFSR